MAHKVIILRAPERADSGFLLGGQHILFRGAGARAFPIFGRNWYVMLIICPNTPMPPAAHVARKSLLLGKENSRFMHEPLCTPVPSRARAY